MSQKYDKLHSVKISQENMRLLAEAQKRLTGKPSIPNLVNHAVERWFTDCVGVDGCKLTFQQKRP